MPIFFNVHHYQMIIQININSTWQSLENNCNMRHAKEI